MFSWSTRHKLAYTGGALLVLSLLFTTIYFKVIYKSPSCSDGVKNGSETGLDCGGSCQKICTSDALNPIILWSKAFPVTDGVYNLSALVENPNVLSINNQVSYKFQVYDIDNQIIVSKIGTTFLPKNKKVIVFEPGVRVGQRKPTRTDFQFVSFGFWAKDQNPEPDLSIDHGILLSTTTSPRIEGSVTNNSLQTIDHLELTAQVLDGKDNTVAVSRTFVDNLTKKSSQQFVFVWNKPFDLGVASCLLPSNVVLVLDQSGSMASLGGNPPEPFETVKKNAVQFSLGSNSNDQIGVVSFAKMAQIKINLSSEIGNVQDAIESLSVATSTENNGTNIADGLSLALQMLSPVNNENSTQAVILLTDGVPTDPIQSGMSDYPKISATEQAKKIKDANISVFTIGLGKDISEGFLKGLASDNSRYFFAPTKNDLSNIYNKVRSSICTLKPSVIQIIYRIVP